MGLSVFQYSTESANCIVGIRTQSMAPTLELDFINFSFLIFTSLLTMQDYQTPESKEMARDLTSQLNLCIQFLVECRPMSMSMGTAIKNLKLKVILQCATCNSDRSMIVFVKRSTHLSSIILIWLHKTLSNRSPYPIGIFLYQTFS